VLAFVHQQDGPSEESAEGWARVIFMTTNSGHPLLVAAKIAGFARTGLAGFRAY
jgi:hypothetical protein